MERLLTLAKVAHLLEVSVKTLANWRSLGIGPEYAKLGANRTSHVRYRAGTVQTYIEALECVR
ncbi:hypothetical protein BN1051_03280 [Arthrobacter saudimassiliensis]|uniref:Helix-turn-helix domain protein n=1 Tax=Arthrobacter saudimassiliensis TaxID=1461584 RepID=A0A078MWQ8_9MICC|nr:hypothetical protein BN1051_03280 [Arthrobacter saudimassiliensis]